LLEAFVALLQFQTLKSIAHKKPTTKIAAAKVSNPTTTCTRDQGAPALDRLKSPRTGV
jgi:hypothetical protein